jgi:hypothetical protein
VGVVGERAQTLAGKNSNETTVPPLSSVSWIFSVIFFDITPCE